MQAASQTDHYTPHKSRVSTLPTLPAHAVESLTGYHTVYSHTTTRDQILLWPVVVFLGFPPSSLLMRGLCTRSHNHLPPFSFDLSFTMGQWWCCRPGPLEV